MAAEQIIREAVEEAEALEELVELREGMAVQHQEGGGIIVAERMGVIHKIRELPLQLEVLGLLSAAAAALVEVMG